MDVRDATPGDAASCAAVYGHYVRDTAVSFEAEPPSAEQMAVRIEAAQRDHAWLVVEREGEVVGYAYGGAWKERAAYRWTAEVSVYLRPDAGGTGAGRLVYSALLERLAERGFLTAVAGMTVPNDASAGLHRALGFEPVGTFVAVGHKLGAWRDVQWWQRSLAAPPDGGPVEPR